MRQPVLVWDFSWYLISIHWLFDRLERDNKYHNQHTEENVLHTDFLKPKKAPKKVSGREMPNQRQRRARRVVNGMAALEPAPQRKRLRMKNTTKQTLQYTQERSEGMACVDRHTQEQRKQS